LVGRRVYELYGDADAITGATYAALEDMGYTQAFADRAHIEVSLRDAQHGGARDHAQVCDA